MSTTKKDSVNRGLRDSQISLYGIFTLTTVAAFVSWLIGRFGFIVLWLLGWSAAVGAVVGAVVAAVMIATHFAAESAGNDRRDYAKLRSVVLRSLLAGIIGSIVVELSTCIIFALQFRPKPGAPTWSVWVYVSNGLSSSPSPFVTAIVLFPAVVGALTNSMACSCRSRNWSAIGYIVAVAGASALAGSAPFFVLLINVTMMLYQNKTHGLMPLAMLMYLGIAALVGAISGAICATIRIGLDSFTGTAVSD